MNQCNPPYQQIIEVKIHIDSGSEKMDRIQWRNQNCEKDKSVDWEQSTSERTQVGSE